MGRYLKYLEIVNTIDEALKKKTAGKVDIDKDLPKIKTMLEVQDLALKMSMCIDRIDDNVKSSFKLYAKGDPSARGVVEEVLEKIGQSGSGGEQSNMGGESARGRDFRGGREDPESDGGNSARAWPQKGRTDARGEMNRHGEEDRRRRGYRSEHADDERYGYEDEPSGLLDHFNEEDRRGRSRRTGRYVHRAEVGRDDPRDFYPLTPPGYPFGMNGGNLDLFNRMGFTDDLANIRAPYNGLLPEQIKHLIPGGNNASNNGGNGSAKHDGNGGGMKANAHMPPETAKTSITAEVEK